jgi:uncharacterized membrane protein (DUF2068 family)
MMLRLIGLFKLSKAGLLFAFALGVLRLAHGDAATMLAHWAREVHIDPDGEHVRRVLQRVLALDPRHLRVVSAGMIAYGAVFVVEGVGLLRRRRWAEWFTVLVTGSFLPLEAYEIWRHPVPLRVAVFVINVAIVWYLASRLRRHR